MYYISLRASVPCLVSIQNLVTVVGRVLFVVRLFVSMFVSTFVYVCLCCGGS